MIVLRHVCPALICTSCFIVVLYVASGTVGLWFLLPFCAHLWTLSLGSTTLPDISSGTSNSRFGGRRRNKGTVFLCHFVKHSLVRASWTGLKEVFKNKDVLDIHLSSSSNYFSVKRGINRSKTVNHEFLCKWTFWICWAHHFRSITILIWHKMWRA